MIWRIMKISWGVVIHPLRFPSARPTSEGFGGIQILQKNRNYVRPSKFFCDLLKMILELEHDYIISYSLSEGLSFKSRYLFRLFSRQVKQEPKKASALAVYRRTVKLEKITFFTTLVILSLTQMLIIPAYLPQKCNHLWDILPWIGSRIDAQLFPVHTKYVASVLLLLRWSHVGYTPE